jgi:hypothetical protein
MNRSMMILTSVFGLQPSQVQTPAKQSVAASEKLHASSMASSDVPLESREYAAIGRLAPAGYARTEFAGWRPWLRRGCARRIDEAREQPADLGADESSLRLRKEFEREFALELRRSDWPAARKF